MKKILLMVLAVLLFSCEDNTAEEDYSLKLWVNGEEVNVESDFKQVTTYTESVEYAGYDSTVTFLKKIFVIHLQKDAGRIEADKEHYAIVFTDWEGDLSNGLPIDGGAYQWPSVCSACPRACMHGAPSKWIRMEVNGTDDYSVSGTGIAPSTGHINPTGLTTISHTTTSGGTTTWTGLDLNTAPNWSLTTPGGTFTMTQSYQGPSLRNRTTITRTSEIETTIVSSSVFSQ